MIFLDGRYSVAYGLIGAVRRFVRGSSQSISFFNLSKKGRLETALNRNLPVIDGESTRPRFSAPASLAH
jgi:hypothetical protein